MTQPTSLLLVDSDLHGLETLTYGFEREGCKVTRTSDLSRAVQLSRTSSPALAVVMLREAAQPAMEVIAALRASRNTPFPIMALGDPALQIQARAAGAGDFLRTPTYIRDVVNAAKLAAHGDDSESLLSEYHGLFYLLRAISATRRSCVLRLSRGQRRAEIRFKDGKVVSANVRALQHLPALHHVLLWEEAAVSIAGGAVAKPSQFPLSAQEILDECERFLRDFAHAARDLGPPNTIYVPVNEPRPPITGLQPNQMAPLLRLFDGKHGLADVVEESPFRIFDTIRMIRRLYEGGVLVTRDQQRRSTGEHRRLGRPTPAANGTQSMLGQWAMVPDQRGVVGDRRSPSRPLMPFGNKAIDQPGTGGDRRRSPSRPVKPLATPGPTPLPTPVVTPLVTPGPTPLPTVVAAPLPAVAATPLPTVVATPLPTSAPVALTPEAVLAAVPQEEPGPKPIPLINKKTVAGEIPEVKPRATPDGFTDLALGPTVQVKVDPDGVPLTLPAVRASDAPPADGERRAVPPALAAEAALPDGEPPSIVAPPVRTAEAPLPDGEPPSLPPVRPATPAPERISVSQVRAHKTPIPGRVTPAAAFDAVEADFFAREADLYKREAVETFDDLDSSGGGDQRPSTRRRRK
jgi:ActR/RegA family two-component response regulator